MFALADLVTARLMRTLSLDGPATSFELAERLALHRAVVCHALGSGLALGVIRSCSDSAGNYEIVPDAVTDAVDRHRKFLLGVEA